MEYKNLTIEKYTHDSFKIKGIKTIYIDPYQLPKAEYERADIVLATHEHFDHLSLEDIKKVVTGESFLVTIPSAKSQVSSLKIKEAYYLSPGQETEIQGVKIKAVASYNINKFRSPGKVFHPKEEGKVGFIVELDGIRIYHAGDTDFIPEMKELGKIDVALLPVSGTYVMTWQEAVEACKVINPDLAIPMHYGSVAGTIEDAKNFAANVPCRVEIL